MSNQELTQKIEELQKQIDALRDRRLKQADFLPGSVKQRAMGEANQYIWAGLEADLPTGNQVTSSTVAYFCTDSNKLKIWNGTAYVSVTLA